MGEVVRRLSFEIGLQASESDALGRPDGDQTLMITVGTGAGGLVWVEPKEFGGLLLTADQVRDLAECLEDIEEQLALEDSV